MWCMPLGDFCLGFNCFYGALRLFMALSLDVLIEVGSIASIIKDAICDL